MQQRAVLVVEDQALTAVLLSDALQAAGFSVRHEPDVPRALAAIEQFDPDAAVLDIDLGPGPTGYDLGTVLSRTRPDIALLFLTDHPESGSTPFHTADVLAGAGFLLKRQISDISMLVAALEAVLHDRPDLARHDYDTPVLWDLTDQQHDLLRCVAMGLTNAAIAHRHGVAESTVERWLVQLFRHLGIGDATGRNRRVEAARRYIAARGLPEAR